MSDCSSCTGPLCLAIIADMLKTFKEISWCIYILDLATTSTTYASVASTNMVEACLVHSRGFLSLNSSTKIPELRISWCFILRNVRTKALVNHCGFPLQAAINWSRSSLRTPAVYYFINWRPCTSIWQHLHPLTCCFLSLLLLVLRRIINCASRVMLSVAAFAPSWWSEWCLRFSWVSAGGVLDEAPVVVLNSVPPSPCWGVSGAMISCCGSEEMMITERSGKSWGRR